MKYILKSIFVLGLCCNLNTQAQLLKEHLQPRAHDKLNKTIAKYLDGNLKGDSCIWDFSNIEPSKDYKIVYSERGDSLLTSESNNISYHLIKGDSLYLLGFENTTTRFNYILPELEIKYPVIIGDSVSCHFSAIGEYSGKYDMDLIGQKSIVVDAQGILITPHKDTLYNIIQVRSLKLMTQTTEKIDWDNLHRYYDPVIISSRIQEDTALIKSENIKWFQYGYRYPIFESVRNSVIKAEKEKEFFSSSYYYPPLEQEDLKYDAENQEIRNKIKEMSEKERESKWISYYNRSLNNMNIPISKTKSVGYNSIDGKNTFGEDSFDDRFDSKSFVLTALYPSPVKDFLHLEYSIPESSVVELTITDMAGKILYRMNEYKDSGNNESAVDMRTMLNGNYIISLSYNGESLHKNIVLKK